MYALMPGKKLEVTAADGAKSTLEANHIIIATGARSRNLLRCLKMARRSLATARR